MNSIVKKILMLIPTFIGITLLTFILVRLLPGDPILAQIPDKVPTPEQYEKAKIALGLDLPYWQQYLIYIKNIFHGDFGYSFTTQQSVLKEFFARFPATLELAFFSIIVALVFGIALGIFAALNRGRWIDNLFMTVALAGYSMPVFWWGLVLVLVFSVNLGWLPVAGYIGVEHIVPQVTGFSVLDAIIAQNPAALASAIKHLVLPTIVLSTIPMAIVARMTRSSMLDVLGNDFIRSLRAKGMSPLQITEHALRNALIPVVTTIGLLVGSLISGSILTENIFSWPGIGKWLIDAINQRDYAVVQSAVLFIAFFVVIINLIVDIIYNLINPRAK